MKHNIIYHRADLDGWCSGAICKMGLLDRGALPEDIQMIGWDYGDEIPEEYLKELGDSIVITDLSFPKETMQGLREDWRNGRDIIWIDHHKSTIEESENGAYQCIDGSRKVGDSASKLAWECFFPDKPLPEIVYWVDRFDVWKKEDPNRPDDTWERVMEMQFGMKSFMVEPKNEKSFKKWKEEIELISSPHFRTAGKTILNFQRSEHERFCQHAFEVEFEGLLFIALNHQYPTSEVLRSVAKPEYDGLMIFRYTGKIWKVSVYHNEISDKRPDMANLIKRIPGSGGHAGAAGFEIEDLDRVINQKYLP